MGKTLRNHLNDVKKFSPAKHKKRKPIHEEPMSAIGKKSCPACKGRHRPHTCGKGSRSSGSSSTGSSIRGGKQKAGGGQQQRLPFGEDAESEDAESDAESADSDTLSPIGKRQRCEQRQAAATLGAALFGAGGGGAPPIAIEEAVGVIGGAFHRAAE